ncbi:MAG: hypothetical protein IKW43_01345 [Bacteroidaceae bacterium]|nr:hypothetical protein [Bacteroidaceae bacterium]
MKFIKVLVPLFFVMMVCSAFSPKNKSNGLYMVGVSASFADSLVYFTEIQYLDSVKLDKKTTLLYGRSQYSEQLDDYMEGVKGMKTRTCFVYFNGNKAKLEKTIKKLKEKYNEGGKSILRDMGSEFKFRKAEEY